MKNKEFAFWRYDQFPYVIGAKVKQIFKDGIIEPCGYGGYTFRPIAFYSISEGQAIKDKLEDLIVKRSEMLCDINELFNNKIKSIFPKALDKS